MTLRERRQKVETGVVKSKEASEGGGRERGRKKLVKKGKNIKEKKL